MNHLDPMDRSRSVRQIFNVSAEGHGIGEEDDEVKVMMTVMYCTGD